MFRNYFKTAFRNTLKHRGYSLINVTGLAIGIACCLLIMAYIQDELSYDSYHENAENMYRIAIRTNANNNILSYPSIGGGIAPAMYRDFPEVVNYVRLLRQNQLFIRIDDRQYEEDWYVFADSTFFEMFSFALLRGDRKTALKEPFTVVLTEQLARKYFDSIDVIGRTVEIDVGNQIQTVTVSGVMENVPHNSHFHPEAIFPIETIVRLNADNPNNLAFLEDFIFTIFYSYILIDEQASIANLEAQLPAFLEKYTSEQQREWIYEIFLQPFGDIHLHSRLLNEMEPNSDITYIYVFAAVAFLTLLVACINFMNLATARSANRAREVGVRKVVGARRTDLISQFFSESFFIAVVSLVLAVIIAELFLPVFNDLSGKQLSIDFFQDAYILPGLLIILLFVGFFAGSYPALFLSGFRPVEVMKGRLTPGAGGAALRKLFVIGQFAVSIAFIICTGIVYLQLDYIRTTQLGFEKENRIIVPVLLPNDAGKVQKMDLMKQEFLRLPGVVGVSQTSSVPGQLRQIAYLRTENASDEDAVQLASVAVDHDYVTTLGIDIAEGRDFSVDFPTDSTDAFILNESAVRDLQLSNPVGTRLEWIAGNIAAGGQESRQIIRSGTVIGVFKDMHYEPFHRNIEPMFLYIAPPAVFNLVIHLSADNLPKTIGELERIWSGVITNRPFKYTFLDQDLGRLYQSEERLSGVVGYFTLLAIFIACLGLLGLASFMAEQRTKEIGIRKVLGATQPGIVRLLSGEFLKLVIIANIIAWPLAYAAGYYWLQSFVYRISIGFGVFLAAAVAALVISQLTVSYQAVRAAGTNPVNALKYE